MTAQWAFWVDRGGTFTDIVANSPEGHTFTHKLLSNNPEHYEDAAVEGIRQCLGLAVTEPIPIEQIRHVKMGTTVATNALLERKGERTLLLVSQGFADLLEIGNQTRSELFNLNIQKASVLYDAVVEVPERVDTNGHVLQILDTKILLKTLNKAYQTGFRSIAIVFMHGYRYSEHEKAAAKVAKECGFEQISTSHEASPLIKVVGRGDTTVVDAYLSPILHRYVNQVSQLLGDVPLYFMQSNGGLVQSHYFSGKNSILSGPAGGIVGMVKTAQAEGFEKVIGFDIGGTSTDVSHFAGEYERTFETQVAGIKICIPMMNIHTVASGGGSILSYQHGRFQVGPDSAGAYPGPTSYRNGGPLSVTDCHVMLGRIQSTFFPSIFGKDQSSTLDYSAVKHNFKLLSSDIESQSGEKLTPEEVAEGFLNIAVDNMANAIRHISVQRGYDVSGYVLNAFGGAGGQHACRVADILGMKSILIHQNAAVLSAYGIGLAEQRSIVEKTLGINLCEIPSNIETQFTRMEFDIEKTISQPGIHVEDIEYQRKAQMHYVGSDTQLLIPWGSADVMREHFSISHKQLYGFDYPEKEVWVEALHVEGILSGANASPAVNDSTPEERIATIKVYSEGSYKEINLYSWPEIDVNNVISGLCLIVDEHNTVIVEPGWQARKTSQGNLILNRIEYDINATSKSDTRLDPIRLEILNNRYMAIAEQMGAVLEKTATSVNIKERLDFSCAIFDKHAELIANAPHIPVHLGSMSDSVKSVVDMFKGNISEGDVFVLNSPYKGGTHLPDITVVKPIFYQQKIAFFTAARGHHADIGGITPGSMPPMSQSIEQEGVIIEPMKLVVSAVFQTEAISELLMACQYPSRNVLQNIADLKAQVAACEAGQSAILTLISQLGFPVVSVYMQYVKDYAEMSVRRLLAALKDGHFTTYLDDGAKIQVLLKFDAQKQTAIIDFKGTSEAHTGNFNAPESVCKAAILYVFRCLIDEPIPLNAGFFRPLEIIIPKGSMLSPEYPAAVVSGNVETSQNIVDCLLGALGKLAASQGTCNNLTFGDADYQYYETLCGGAGAGDGFAGASAVHTHMTNSRLTDPEILEQRFPVLLTQFGIRGDSGGEGEFSGGNGVFRRIQFLKPMTVAIISSHRKVKPFGLAGGAAGSVGENWWIAAGSAEKVLLKHCDQLDVATGDSIEIRTPGGGGYGRKKT